jgi:hypothetical protein
MYADGSSFVPRTASSIVAGGVPSIGLLPALRVAHFADLIHASYFSAGRWLPFAQERSLGLGVPPSSVLTARWATSSFGGASSNFRWSGP